MMIAITKNRMHLPARLDLCASSACKRRKSWSVGSTLVYDDDDAISYGYTRYGSTLEKASFVLFRPNCTCLSRAFFLGMTLVTPHPRKS